MKKRILSLCLALIMVLALTPAVFAETITGNGYKFDTESGVLTITTSTVPQRYEGRTHVYDAFREDVKEIVITRKVSTINDYACSYMVNLEKITFEQGENTVVHNIGKGAFEGCTKLTTIDFPMGSNIALEVEGEAFKDCTSLYHIGFGDTNVTSIAQDAFTGCTSLTPDGITGNDPQVTAFVDDAWAHPEKYGFLPVAFDGHTLYLADDIVVLFGVKKFTTDFDFTNVTVKFTINNNTTVSATEYTEIGGKYFYACPINALELADTITAEFYDGVNLKARDTYKAMDYIDYVLEGNHAQDLAGEKADQLKELACALQDYGHYLQLSGWTDGKSHNTIAASASNNDLSLVSGYVGGYAMAYDAADFPDGVKISLSLNSTTTLYVKAGSAVNSVNSIAPNDLDRGYDIDLGGKTVTASALSYVYAVLSSTDTETFTAAKKDAVAALYYYWAAAEAYAPNN